MGCSKPYRTRYIGRYAAAGLSSGVGTRSGTAADEPTANLDPILRAKLWHHFRTLAERGRTLCITTQYIDEAEQCDRVGLMYHGALIAHDSPDALRRQAFGGDVLELVLDEAAAPVVAVVTGIAGVRDVREDGATTLRITVEHAQHAIPRVLQAVESAGTPARSVAHERPTFDEVFIRLIEQHGGERPPLGVLQTSAAGER